MPHGSPPRHVVLILREQEHHGIPFFDTTKIHADAVVARLLS